MPELTLWPTCNVDACPCTQSRSWCMRGLCVIQEVLQGQKWMWFHQPGAEMSRFFLWVHWLHCVIIIAFIISMSIKLTKRYCFYIHWGKIIFKNSRNLVGFQFKLISNIKLTRMSYLVISEICHTPGILVCFFQFLKISFSSLTWGNLLSSFGHWETPFSRAWWICSPLTSIRTRESITGKIESKSWQMANQTKLKCLETFLVTINNALHKMEYRGWDRIEH